MGEKNIHYAFIKTSLFLNVIMVAIIVGTAYPVQLTYAGAETPYEFVFAWGSYGKLDGQFNGPHGVAVDSSGNVYVVEERNFRVQKFTLSGDFVLKWGQWGIDDGEFTLPHGVAVDSSGNVYIVDYSAHNVQKFTSGGDFIRKWGGSGATDGLFSNPHGAAVDAQGYVYITDKGNNRVQKFTSDGVFVAKWGSYGTGDGKFNGPRGIAIDSSGNVYVVDLENNRVQKFTTDGVFVAKWGSYGTGDGQFDVPRGVAVDSVGNVFVSDINNNRIQKFTPSGAFISEWGSSGDGEGEFDEPCGIAVDSSGGVYANDVGNNRMQKFAMGSASVVRLESLQDSGLTSNLGTITFDGAASSLPAYVNATPGTSTSALYAAAAGYVFDHWEATGGVTVSSAISNPTTASVSGGGTLRAVYKSSTSLSVVSPNGGESWVRGSYNEVKWSTFGATGSYVKIELLKAGALNRVLSSSTPNDGSYNWYVSTTQTLGEDYRIRVTSTSAAVTDSSDSDFTMVPQGSLTLASPNGGESWYRGTTRAITWNSVGSVGEYVRIDLYKTGVLNRVVSYSTPNDGSHDWAISATQSLGADYSIRVRSTSMTSIADYSDAYFTIAVDPSWAVVVTSPNGGESWIRGTTQYLTWTKIGTTGSYVKIELLKAGALDRVIVATTANTGSYRWTVPLTMTPGVDYGVRVTSTSYPSVTDSSNAYFTVASGALAVTSPNGGEQWVPGVTHTLTWTRLGTTGSYVKIELLKAGVVDRVIAGSAANTGSYTWVIPDDVALGTDYRIRVSDTLDEGVVDQSDAYFSMAVGGLTVASPNTAVKWVQGTIHSITWKSEGSPGTSVRIELLKGGVVDSVISEGTANDGYYVWTIPSGQALGADYRVRVSSTSLPYITDSSNVNFSVTVGAITVTSPNTSVSWARGSLQTIRWSSVGSPGEYVKIELLKGGAVNLVIAAAAVNSSSYSWTVPDAQVVGADYRIRVTSTTIASISDISNYYFSVT